MFCPNCGTKNTSQELEVKKNKFCSECGSKVAIGAKFCPECGAKIN